MFRGRSEDARIAVHNVQRRIVAKLEKRYVAAVTASGAAVGSTAVLPGLGTLAALSAAAGEITRDLAPGSAIYGPSIEFSDRYSARTGALPATVILVKSSALADIGAGRVLRQQCGGLLTVWRRTGGLPTPGGNANGVPTAFA